MHWQDIRAQFPNQWVLLEAIKAHSEGDERILDEIAVIQRFDDSSIAWKDCFRLQREYPQREFYAYHTHNETIKIQEKVGLGLRTRA